MACKIGTDYVPKADNIYLVVESRLLQLVIKTTGNPMCEWTYYDVISFRSLSNDPQRTRDPHGVNI